MVGIAVGALVAAGAIVAPAFDLIDANDYWAIYVRDPDVDLPT